MALSSSPDLSRTKKIAQSITNTLELVLSLLLIVYISYDTFMQIPYLSNGYYMSFQLFVCIVFIIDFFIGLFLADNRKSYFKTRWFFLLISIPYLNIINYFDIYIPSDIVYYLRFIPLIRGAYSLAIVVGYFSANRAASLLTQYTAILTASVYILALLFYYQEYGVNTHVTNFWDALYWSAMNMTTVGCYFSAVTPAGKIISVILPILGMLMLPLFTVFITDRISRFNKSKS
ncbi:MAG: potassium channel family protein [Clostridium sp.]|nr:potassium channel family protein [Clostridium sp.]